MGAIAAAAKAMMGKMNFIIDGFYTFPTGTGNDGYLNLVKILVYKGSTS